MLEVPATPIKFAVFCTRPHLMAALGATLAVIASTAISRVLTYVVRIVTDTAVSFGGGTAPISALWFWSLIVPAVYIVNESIWRCSGFCGMRWITGAAAEAYRSLFAHLARHSASYFSDRYAGALTNKISNASRGIEQLLAGSLWQLVPLFVGLAGDLALCFMAHFYFAIILFVWGFIYLGINIFFVIKLRRLAYTHAESSSNLKGKIVDSASNIETVQQSGDVEFEKSYISTFIHVQRQSHLHEWWYSEWVLISNGILLAIFIGAMLATSTLLIGRGEITVGTLVMMITLVLALEHRLFFLGQQLSQIVSYYGQVAEGLCELLEPHAIPALPDAAKLNVTGGEIVFDRVSFAYRDNSIFHDFSLTIRGGQKVGLVGPSGAGKSTLVNLLLRQFDVKEGQIRIDGMPISEVDLDSLRRAIAIVPQSSSLFHRSVIDNIRYGRLEASDEEVFEAARSAEADEFVRSLPKGYETFVGERGVKLSGGQRQRVAIARALIKRAPILLLDEATSSLDSESEGAIQKALATLMKGKTVVAIAHRLSTLRTMDRILVLAHGKIVEDGSHQELLKKQGLYARLWSNQVSGFIQEDLPAEIL